ncbi:MAG: DUF305 domain-containing protein [Actinomycetota bacterium]|nr:DUF305 domain-containing protein [Actinomycetota bacterium]
MNKRPLAITASALALTALLATFGATQPANAVPTPAPMSESNTMMGKGAAGDIAFAQMMIPHHQQAIQMSDIALKYAKSPQLLKLAKQIKAAQNPEITTMRGWLRGWGAPISPSANHSVSGGMHGTSMGSTGMMSDAYMAKLAGARGAAFDTMWLQMMITHHQGAITSARQVLKTTSNGLVQKLAKSIIAGQSTEIATMKQLLAK